MKNSKIFDRFRVLNNRRIERRRLQKPFGKTPHGFEFRGLDEQFGDNWEKAEQALLSTLFLKAQRFVNIGAHYGYYVCLARSFGLPTIAFEPVDANFKMLMANVKKNGFEADCGLVHSAVGSKLDITTIVGAFSGGTLAGNSVKPEGLSQQTPVVTLDGFIPDIAGYTVVLMDVEWFEFEVLKGAKNLVGQPEKHAWVIEIFVSGIARDGSTFVNQSYADTFRVMFDAGYKVWHIGDKLTAIDSDELLATYKTNPSACPNGNFLFLDPHSQPPNV